MGGEICCDAGSVVIKEASGSDNEALGIGIYGGDWVGVVEGVEVKCTHVTLDLV